jgi:flagellin
VTFQVGANSAQTITVTFKDIDGMSGMTTAVVSATISTVAVANSAISAVDTALATIDSFRSDMGAKINRLTYAADNLTNVITNTGASRSRILDADYAKTATDLARTQIIQQAATAMLAQANQEPQSVLSLLKG